MRNNWFYGFILTLGFGLFMACNDDDGNQPDAEDPKAANRQTLGTSANDILADGDFSRLIVELVYPPTFRPTEAALVDFRNFIEERVFKSGGVVFVETVIDPPQDTSFTLEEIRAIEEENRTEYNQGSDLAIYIFFANENSSNDGGGAVTLGTAYRNTSIVIYEATLKAIAASNPGLLPTLESVTLNHEFGHLLGLTNILNDDIHTDHEDPDQERHCVVQDCLMYFDATAVTNIMIEQLASRSMVPALDPLCIADLQAKGGR